jgi:outer membrane receptor protein involved in Fe transport
MADMNPWKDVYGHQILWQPEFYSTLRNPYWTLNEDFNNDQSDRFLTLVSLDYKFTDWLKLKLRHGMDMRNAFSESGTAFGIWNNRANSTGEATYNNFSGYGANRTKAVETNADFLFTANKKIDNFNVSLSAGGNQQRSTFNQTGGNTGNLDLPGVYTLAAGAFPRPYSKKVESRLNSLYGFLNLSYQDYLFVDVTYRNDWSSTLSPENRSFHYPSYSGSLVITDMLKKSFNTSLPTFISFLKIRGGYAQAGNTIDPYKLYPSYDIRRGFFNAIVTNPPANSSGQYILVNPNILPEIVKSQEYGIDIRFLNNRIGADFTYYKKNAYNQIIDLKVPAATGYNLKTINAGNLQNEGYEIVLNGSILKKADGLNWDIVFNYSHNTNKVVELHPDIKTFPLQGDEQSRAVRVLANEGEIYGNMYGRDFARTADGQVIIEDDGTPRKSEDKNVLIGNYQPKYTMGFSNTFSYKGLSLSFLIDVRTGGQFYSQTMAYMYANGNAKGTLPFRDGGMIVEGVRASDNAHNSTPITAQQYWSKVAGAEPVASLFIYDASNTRLREVVLGYTIPNKALGKAPIHNVTLSLVGRNLWLIKSHIPGIDPESSFSTTNSQGIENGAYPSTRTVGFNLKLEF